MMQQQQQQGTDQSRSSGRNHDGLIGLVNIGNSCYMNASLQALANCPPFCQFFIECSTPGPSNNVSVALSSLFKKMWISERNPGNLNPRSVSSNMRQRIFRGSQQQDAQEFIRCLLNQVHDEISLPVFKATAAAVERQQEEERQKEEAEPERQKLGGSLRSIETHSSASSTGSLTKLVPFSSSSHSLTTSTSPPCPDTTDTKPRSNKSLSLPNTPFMSTKLLSNTTTALRNHLSDEVQKRNPKLLQEMNHVVSDENQEGDNQGEEEEEGPSPWRPDDVFVVNLLNGQASRHGSSSVDDKSGSGMVKDGIKNERERHSIITEVFQGEIESRVKCLHCKKISITKEHFQDLSLPIPGRKDIDHFRKHEPSADKDSTSYNSEHEVPNTFRSQFCRVWKFVFHWAQDVVTGPDTSLEDCLNAFFATSDLTGENSYFCDHCKSFQNSRKDAVITKLPEILCIHLKRFRYDAFFTSKISRYIQFPLTGLDMSKYLKSSGRKGHSGAECKYELVSMVTHFGGAGGGHYIAFCRNRKSNCWHEFDDSHVSRVSASTIENSEAYLLFYRRVPSTAVQPLNIADIVPPPEVPIPSEDTCFISRNWLMLRNLCVDPGPVLQYQYACQHGGILPGKEGLADLLALPIQRSIWEKLIKQYGGGPLVESKETCQECESHLSQLTERRKKEKEEANQIEDACKSKPRSFLLSNSWLTQWRGFINCGNLEVDPPGPINNSCLLDVTEQKEVKFCKKAQYIKISKEVWKYLHGIYGGGPTLTTSVPET